MDSPSPRQKSDLAHSKSGALKKNASSRWFSTLKDDLIAGLIVAIVALPLAIGFSIASGVDPAMGVYTAIVAGFFAALLGGSSYQISGPTGAMVVVILSVVNQHGVKGLVLSTFIAGVILIVLGLARLGKIIEFIPSPVIVGFTAGIAFIIFFGQLNNAFGINPAYPSGAEFIEKTVLSLEQLPFHAHAPTTILFFIALACLIIMPRVSKKIPGSIIAVLVATLLSVWFASFFDVRTVSDVGTIPRSIPWPILPEISWQSIKEVFPAALTIAALAAIESLLSAVVADGLTDTKHNPNRELFGQGVANILSSVFGGMPATGAIARTATNIRNGGKSRLSAIFHSAFLLLFVLVAGPLAAMIPLAALGAILMFVAFNMVEWERVFLIFRTPMSDVVVMLTTFFLTVLIDLTVAIEVGLVLAALLFMKRMSDLYRIESEEGRHASAGSAGLVRGFRHRDISIYTVSGPLFFGAASRFDQAVATMPGGHRPIKIIRMKHVPVIDATGLNFIHSTYVKHRRRGGVVLFSTVHPDVMQVIRTAGLEKEIGAEHFFSTTKQALTHALKHAHRLHHQKERVSKKELARFNVSRFDREESSRLPSTRDQDPVSDMLDTIGIKSIGPLSQRTIQDPMGSILGSLGIGRFHQVEKKAPIHKKKAKVLSVRRK